LKYSSHQLAWSEYFFDFEHYCELFDYLSKHQQEYPKRRPIAVAVEVLPSVEPRLATSGYWRVLCRSLRCVYEDKKDEPFAVRPVLYVFDKQLASKLRVARYVLACGLPRLGDFQPPQKPGLSPCADVALNIEDAAQVCRYRPMLRDENP
jgi:hypothetical protein